MNKHQQNILFSIGIGMLLAFNIFVNIYNQPNYNLDIVQFNYKLLTQDGKDLGLALSTIKLSYIPGKNWGKFLLLIETNVSKPYWYRSIFSKDVKYRVIIRQDSSIIEQVESSYLGSLNPERGKVMYGAFFLPSDKHSMNNIESIYGNILLNFEGSFYNTSNNQIWAISNVNLHLYIIHPSTRIVLFSFLIIYSSIFIIIRSGRTFARVKNIWER